MSSPSTFGPLLKTVLEAISEVFIMCSAGWILARQGILDKKTQKQLNRCNVSLFTPCLLFSKVAFSLTPAKLKELWIIPLFFVFITSVSAICAWLLGSLLRLKRSQRNFTIAAAMFNNSNSLPIALMQSLVVTVHGLKWGKDDTKDAMLGRALGYLVLYSTLGMVLRWSYGVHLLSQADEEVTSEGQPQIPEIQIQDPTPQAEHPAFLLPYTPQDLNASVHRAFPSVETPSRIWGGRSPKRAQTALPSVARNKSTRPVPTRAQSRKYFRSFPNTPVRSLSPSPSPTPRRSAYNPYDGQSDTDNPTDVSGGEEDEWGTIRPTLPRHLREPSRTRWQQIVRRIRHKIVSTWKAFMAFMTVPLWAASASLIVALIQPLQHVLDAHAAPIKGFLNSAGSCSIPLTLVVLGAYFYKEPAPAQSEAKKATNGRGVHVEVGGDGSTSTDGEMETDGEAGETAALGRSQGARSAENGVSSLRGDEAGLGNGVGTGIVGANGVGPRAKSTSSQSSLATIVGSVRGAFGMKQMKPGKAKGKGKEAEEKSRPGETRTVFAAVVARMVLTPLVVLPLVALLAVYDVHRIFDDPVFVVSNVLLISSPPALTLAQITQAASGDAFERLISRTIFWAYCIFTPPLTLFYVVIGLWFSRL